MDDSQRVTVAGDAKLQVEFNPAVVKSYRLIGYENRALQREDFSNDRVDAGDVGLGHKVTARYELELQSATQAPPPLRYGDARPETSLERASTHAGELAYVHLRYKRQGQANSEERSWAVVNQGPRSIHQASEDFRFAAAVAGFGDHLRAHPAESGPEQHPRPGSALLG